MAGSALGADSAMVIGVAVIFLISRLGSTFSKRSRIQAALRQHHHARGGGAADSVVPPPRWRAWIARRWARADVRLRNSAVLFLATAAVGIAPSALQEYVGDETRFGKALETTCRFLFVAGLLRTFRQYATGGAQHVGAPKQPAA